MKNLSKILIVFLILTNVTVCCFAQEMTADEKKAFQVRAKEKIDEYQHYLSEIASKEVSNDVKTGYVHQALNLFIGQGESYNYTDENGSSQMHAPVKTQISSLNRRNSHFINTKIYLQNLINLTYTKVELSSGDAVRVDNIHKVNGQYRAVAYICQKFKGYRDGRLAYEDVTSKRIEIIMELKDVGGEKIWRCFLGNTYVVETKRQ
jgi:hypothetical protein